MKLEITDVQKALRGADYPATGPELAQIARDNGADGDLVDTVEGIDGEMSGPDAVMHALKGSLTGADQGGTRD